jgi:thiamine-phosphate pyrophosphorylase
MAVPRLYAIVDEEIAARHRIEPVAVAEALLEGGVRWLQLRAKQAPSATSYAWAGRIAALARARQAAFVVNDRADIAALVGAGVHVGQDDLPVAAVRALVGTEASVGLSTHTLTQIAEALEEPISYLAVGPVFGSVTKDTGYAPVGLALVEAAAARAGGRVPVVAIGGITLERAPDVLAAGASAVAVIGDLAHGASWLARARQWVDCLDALP